MSAYDDAVAELYQAPHGSFVEERKRLANELKAAGDKATAAKVAKLARPTISAWAVNQLWWHARDAFDALLETAARLRKGDLKANAAHRDAIAKLRARAARMLADAGHGATEGTLRKVTQSLSALAASGGWNPDPPGAISEDRDPPGFEAIGIGNATSDEAEVGPEKPAKPEPKREKHAAKHAEEHKPSRDELAEARKRKEAAEAAAREQAAAERKRLEQERARIKAEKHRLEAALRTAKGEITAQERDVEKLRKQLAEAEDNLAQAEAVAEDLQAKLDELD
jgi:DNA repair exonuclease SbcCD ATPase subunit